MQFPSMHGITNIVIICIAFHTETLHEKMFSCSANLNRELFDYYASSYLCRPETSDYQYLRSRNAEVVTQHIGANQERSIYW